MLQGKADIAGGDTQSYRVAYGQCLARYRESSTREIQETDVMTWLLSSQGFWP